MNVNIKVLYKLFSGKLPVFLKPASKTDKNAHFGVSHYAGVVNYNVTSWLEKNKDDFSIQIP